MPKSFLVKKGHFLPQTSSYTGERFYRQHQFPSWSNAVDYGYPDINLLQQHYLLSLTALKPVLEAQQPYKADDDQQPLDYSLKKTASSQQLSSPSTSSSRETESGRNSPDSIHSFTSQELNLLDIDGRSKRRKYKAIVDDKSKYVCGECGKNYATSSNLSRHKQTHRSMNSNQAKKCPHCDKVYVSMPALSMHILTHKLKHVCTECNKAFSRPWLLQGHMRSHTGERPYACTKCSKRFADRSNLRAHMQTHVDTKHYPCNKCEKTFTLKAYLHKHIESSCVE